VLPPLIDFLERQSAKAGWLNALLLLLAGASLVFSYAPYGYWFLAFPGLVLLCLPLPRLTAKASFWHGFWFALGYFGAGMSWVHVSMYYFGGTGAILSIILTFVFVAYLAIFPATAVYLLNRYFKQRDQLSYWLLAWPFCWFLMEWVRGWFFTGLPWLNIGHGQINGPLAEFAPVLGANLMSILVILWVGVVVLWLRTTANINLETDAQQSKKKVQKAALIVTFILVASNLAVSQITWVEPSNESIRVAMLQPKVAQDKKWDTKYRFAAMRHLYQETKNLDEPLIIWPEAAIPALAYQVQDFLDAVDSMAESNAQTILTGIPIERNNKYYNAVTLLGQSEGEYSKRHLVLFGEYVPFEEQIRGLIEFFDMPMSSFSKGALDQPRLVIDGHQIAMAICFEITFQDLVQQQVKDSRFLVTLSNDAWFGESFGPHQHLEIARLRALENGIPVIRGTNDGISAFIDADGTLIKTLGKGVKGKLQHELQLYRGETLYSRLGPQSINLILFSLLVLGLILTARKK